MRIKLYISWKGEKLGDLQGPSERWKQSAAAIGGDAAQMQKADAQTCAESSRGMTFVSCYYAGYTFGDVTTFEPPMPL